MRCVSIAALVAERTTTVSGRLGGLKEIDPLVFMAPIGVLGDYQPRGTFRFAIAQRDGQLVPVECECSVSWRMFAGADPDMVEVTVQPTSAPLIV